MQEHFYLHAFYSETNKEFVIVSKFYEKICILVSVIIEEEYIELSPAKLIKLILFCAIIEELTINN